jgi:hypothetical protein
LTELSFEAPTLGIGKLLKEGARFFVPHHQRDYSWTDDEIEQFLADIQEARAAKRPDYFIGLMVFIRRNQGELTILDGQQRLVTAQIVLACIRNWLRNHGHDQDAEQVQTDYIALRELGRDYVESRLVLNENNNKTFQDFVIQHRSIDEVQKALDGLKRHDPNRRLLESILLCQREVETIAGKEQEAGLFELVKYLKESVKTVQLVVPDEANAFTVFETLNDRGLDLSILDLVKNYVFGKCGEDRLREIQKNWSQMMANLTNVPADDFLKSYWTSRYGRIQTAQLFQSFKAKVDSLRRVSETSDDMLKTSEQYAALEIADDPIWNGISERSRQRVRTLKVLGARQVHPVLLSALVRFSLRELQRLLRLLEVLIVRYQLIGGGRTGRLEIACASLSAAMYQKSIRTATEAFRELRNIFPADNEFREAFKWKQERNNRKARYVLETLESHAQGGMKELAPAKSLTVEHILPKSPSSSWRSALQQDASLGEECTYRLGNLCLLSGINKDLGAESFDEKRKIYAKSRLVLTRKVSNYTEWNRDSIEKHQEEMARLAVTAWRFV